MGGLSEAPSTRTTEKVRSQERERILFTTGTRAALELLIERMQALEEAVDELSAEIAEGHREENS